MLEIVVLIVTIHVPRATPMPQTVAAVLAEVPAPAYHPDHFGKFVLRESLDDAPGGKTVLAAVVDDGSALVGAPQLVHRPGQGAASIRASASIPL